MSIDINSIKRNLLVKCPFFGSIITKIKFIEDINCIGYNGNPTAGTDGDKVYYHPDFINSLNGEEQVFVFAHEICHIALNHIKRSKDRDQKLWNIATDAVINANLKKDGFKPVEGAVDIDEAFNYDAETFYDKLLQDKKLDEQNNKFKSSSNQKDNNLCDYQDSSISSDENNNEDSNINYDVGHDTHRKWEESLKRYKDKANEIKNESNNTKDNLGDSKKEKFWEKLFNKNKNQQSEQDEDNKNDSLDNIDEESFNTNEKQIFQENREERRKNIQKLKDSFTKKSISSGKTTNESFRNIDNIGDSSSLIDWKKLLRDAIKVDIDWSYENASIVDGVVTPYLEEFPKPETEIVLDTSGSIDDLLLRNFLKECKNILQTSKVKVGCFDTKFYGFQEIKTEEDIDNMQFIGHGGTDFDVAVNAFSRRVENKIIFTDGEAKMPSTSINAIWVVFGGRKINPMAGKVVYISDDQLRNLYNTSYENIGKGKLR